jgi:hypothetical protein
MNIFIKFFNYIRGKKTPDAKVYPRKFLITVFVDHPRILGHVSSFRIAIDGYDKAHARQQLRKELSFFIGGAAEIKK